MSEKVFGSKEISREFLLTQVLLVLSTVLGIFLAAQQGFTKAVEFDYLKGDIDGWHVRTAVRAELIHNLSTYPHADASAAAADATAQAAAGESA